MKKTLFATTLLSLTLCLCGCDNFTKPTFENSKMEKLKNVNGFFLVNTTDEKKDNYQIWSKIRSVTDETTETIQYENGTRTFYWPDLPATVKLNTSRVAEKTQNPKKYKINDKHTFNETATNSNVTNGRYIATMRYESKHWYIWQSDKEKDNSLLTDEEIKEFADTFDLIYEKETALCGPKFDGATPLDGIIPADEKISVVLLDITDNFTGVFCPDCFYKTSNGENQIECIYIDSVIYKNSKTRGQALSAASHEFNHMLNFVNKYLKNNIDIMSNMSERWYTEMLSMTIEDFFNSDLGLSYDQGPQQRLYSLLSDSTYIHGFKNWHYNDGYTYASYANAYAFGAFLARNYGGAKLIHEIATNNYKCEESVVQAVNKINGTNKTFEDLLCEFPYILVNESNQNPNYPSLDKATKDTLPGMDNYYYQLDKIGSSKIPEGMSIPSLSPESLERRILDGYGFQFVKFENPQNVTVEYKNFLICKTF